MHGWGGRRAGAGRPASPGRRAVPHRRRESHDRRCPAHVTLRAMADLPSLRDGRVFSTIRQAFAAMRDLRLLHYSVQHDHVHLLVEADEAARFPRGVQGLAIRLAKAINRALGRHGRVWSDRYHARALRTPRELRNALVYVLNNARKHLRAMRGLDPCSSAPWFDGWSAAPAHSGGTAPIAAPRTWLARVGRRRLRLMHLHETTPAA